MRLIDPKLTYFIGGSKRHPMTINTRSVGGSNSLPPWTRGGITYATWKLKHPSGLKCKHMPG